MGDIVLRDAAAIFKRQLRDYDLVVRNGGDEFVIALPGTPPSDAARTADRIRKEIAAYAKQTIGKNCAQLGVSVGVASYPDDATTPESLLASADAAMYRDKRSRKQQIAA
jgi:diguanylate cyclase (GGDEF)-like protein